MNACKGLKGKWSQLRIPKRIRLNNSVNLKNKLMP